MYKCVIRICRIAFLLALIVIISIPSSAASQAEKKYMLNQKPAITDEEQAREFFASAASQRLFNTFWNEYWSYIERNQLTPPDTYLVSSLPSEAYPSYYAGAYINRNFDLVIVLTDDSDAIIQKVNSIIGYDSITYRKGQYSYSCLINCMNDIMQYFKCASNPIIRYAYIDDYTNRVVVGLCDLSDSTKKTLATIITDIECIKCVECKKLEPIQEESGLKPHRDMFYSYHTWSNEVSDYSYAVKATRDNKTGFITAGHAVYTDEYSYSDYELNQLIGQCKASLNGVYTDSAFVQTNTGVTLDSWLLSSEDTILTLSNTVTTVNQGCTINFTAYSTKDVVGTVITASYMLTVGNDNNIFYADMIISDYLSQSGDSGGIIYKHQYNSSIVDPVAIHKGTISTTYLDAGGVNYGGYSPPYKICSKMNYALSALSATLNN